MLGFRVSASLKLLSIAKFCWNEDSSVKRELGKLKFKKGNNSLISTITADEIFNADELKDLIVKQKEMSLTVIGF